MRHLNLFNYIWMAIYQFLGWVELITPWFAFLENTNFKGTKTLKQRSAFLTLNTAWIDQISEKIIYIGPVIY